MEYTPRSSGLVGSWVLAVGSCDLELPQQPGGRAQQPALRIHAADDLRLASYLDERFSAASQPTDEEIRQAGEAARPTLAAERRQTLVSAWVADLRRRADVRVLQ